MSIFLWYGYPGSLRERAQKLLEGGFESMSMWWEEEDGKEPLANLEALRKMAIACDQVHMPYFSGGLWGQEVKIYEEEFIQALEELSLGEIPLAVFHPIKPGEETILELDRGLEAFHRIYTRAKELGVELAGENLRDDYHLLTLLEEFELGLCLDTGHLGVSGNYELLKGYFGRIKSLHIHDNDGKKDLHLLPGHGVLPLKDWLEQVPKGTLYHLEVNKGLSNHYYGLSESRFIKEARRSLDFLGGSSEG